jgi:hypothetical protein
MKPRLFLISGLTLLSVFLILGCSKDFKNPIDPKENLFDTSETSLKKNGPITDNFDQSKFDSDSSSFKGKNRGIMSILESSAASSEEVELIGDFWCYAFQGIYDVTKPGGLPTVKFKARSSTVNWAGNPVFIPKISAEGWGYRGTSLLWHDKDEKQDWWDASILSPPIGQRIKWTAGLESDYFFDCGGGNAGTMNLSRIEYTVDFYNYIEKTGGN